MNSLEYMHPMQCVHKFGKAGFQVLLYSNAFKRKKSWGGILYPSYILYAFVINTFQGELNQQLKRAAKS